MAGDDRNKNLIDFGKDEIIAVLPIAVIVTGLNILACLTCPPCSVILANAFVTALGTLVTIIMMLFLARSLRRMNAAFPPAAAIKHVQILGIDLGILMVGLAIYGAVLLQLPLETETTKVFQTHKEMLLAFSHNYRNMSTGQMIHHNSCFFFFNFLTFLAVRAIGHSGGAAAMIMYGY
jgi:hypothetical protein